METSAAPVSFELVKGGPPSASVPALSRRTPERVTPSSRLKPARGLTLLSHNTYSVIPGPRALGSALCAVRAQAPRAEPGIHNHRPCGCDGRASNCRLGLWFP